MIRMRTRTFGEINSNDDGNNANGNSDGWNWNDWNDGNWNGWNNGNGNCLNDGGSEKECRIGETPSSNSSVGSSVLKICVSGRSKARAIERRDVSITVAGLTTDEEDASLWEDQMIRMRSGCKKIPRRKKWFCEQMREGVGEYT